MQLARLVLDYVKALSWPMVTCAVVFFFRGTIRRLLADRLDEVTAAGVSAKFKTQAEQLAQEAEEILGKVDGADLKDSPPDATPAELPPLAKSTIRRLFDHARDVINQVPLVAVNMAWSNVELVLEDAMRLPGFRFLENEDSAEPHTIGLMRFRAIKGFIKEGRKYGLPVDLALALEELSNLREDIRQETIGGRRRDTEVGATAALYFVDAAERLTLALVETLRKDHQTDYAKQVR
jgi:hypothetical protein